METEGVPRSDRAKTNKTIIKSLCSTDNVSKIDKQTKQTNKTVEKREIRKSHDIDMCTTFIFLLNAKYESLTMCASHLYL